MIVTVSAIGKLKELNIPKEIELEEDATSMQFTKKLLDKAPELKDHTFSLSVNNAIVNSDIRLNSNDKVVLIQPFEQG